MNALMLAPAKINTRSPQAFHPPPAHKITRTRPCASPGRVGLQIEACHRCLHETHSRHRLTPQLLQHSSGRPGTSAAAALNDRQEGHQADAGTGNAADAQEQQAEEGQQAAEPAEQEDSVGVKAALAMLKFYKVAISPLLPPACRFQPTCSVYAMEAFQRHGVGKGFVLTAWRLLRCTPWGNSGYDPVRWPPAGLESIFKAMD